MSAFGRLQYNAKARRTRRQTRRIHWIRFFASASVLCAFAVHLLATGHLPSCPDNARGDIEHGRKELREKYGGKLAKASTGRSGRRCPAACRLDRLTIGRPAMHSGWKERNGKPTEAAAAYFKHKQQVVEKMEAIVRQKWGSRWKQKTAKVKRKRSGKIDQADRKPRRRIGGGRRNSRNRQVDWTVRAFPLIVVGKCNVVRRANNDVSKVAGKSCVLPIAENRRSAILCTFSPFDFITSTTPTSEASSGSKFEKLPWLSKSIGSGLDPECFDSLAFDGESLSIEQFSPFAFIEHLVTLMGSPNAMRESLRRKWRRTLRIGDG